MSEGQEKLLAEIDDDFHPPRTGGWFEHETSWFAFYVPEHNNLGAWIFNYVRPNAGISGGGVVLWDDTSWFHMETPYYRHYAAMKLPEPRDLRDMVFPSGLTLKMLEPLQRYHLSFRDDPRLTFDLEFNAVMRPWVDVPDGHEPEHLDQMGRVTGELVLHGERVEVDSCAMRDRSWGTLRSERWETDAVGGYTCAAADQSTSFFIMGYGPKKKGFLVRQGERAGLVEGIRTFNRDPEAGYITDMRIQGKDALGRSFEVDCECTSRVAMPIPGVSGVCWTTLFRCELDGHELWGEDQDFWSLYHWSEYRRSTRLGGNVALPQSS
jgi:hypothetical protein